MKRTIINLAYRDGRIETLHLTPVLQMHCERTMGINFVDGLRSAEEGMRVAWEAVRRARPDAVVPGFEVWVEDLDACEFEREDVHPTGAGARGGANGTPATSSSTAPTIPSASSAPPAATGAAS